MGVTKNPKADIRAVNPADQIFVQHPWNPPNTRQRFLVKHRLDLRGFLALADQYPVDVLGLCHTRGSNNGLDPMERDKLTIEEHGDRRKGCMPRLLRTGRKQLRFNAYEDVLHTLRRYTEALYEVPGMSLGVQKNQICGAACQPLPRIKQPGYWIMSTDQGSILNDGIVQREEGVPNDWDPSDIRKRPEKKHIQMPQIAHDHCVMSGKAHVAPKQ